MQRQQSLYCLCWGVWRYARPRTTAACRAAFRRVKVRVGALARRSSGCFTEQFGRHGSGATFAARLRELSAFGSRQAPWHESPPSRCTKTPTTWASPKGECTFSCLFVSCVGRFSCPADGAPAGAAVAERLARLCLKPCRGERRDAERPRAQRMLGILRIQ